MVRSLETHAPSPPRKTASVFRPETKMATFEVFQREVKPLSDSFKDSMSAVSGPHKTDAAFEINEVRRV